MSKLSPSTPETLTTAEAAAILGCHPRTVARMAADGRLAPLLKLAGPRGAYLFPREHIEAVQRSTLAARCAARAAS